MSFHIDSSGQHK